MNKDMKRLINSVLENDLSRAKYIIEGIINDDKTEKDAFFRDNILRKIKEEREKEIEVPRDLKRIIQITNPSECFNEKRYYLSNKEEKIANEVEVMYKVSQHLKESNIRYVNSLMLYGESGTGKTLFANYIAYKLNLPFVYVNFAHLIDSLLGQTAKNVYNLFEFINYSKCVLMIDEIDAIGQKRGKSNETTELSRIVISLMQGLDTINNETTIIAATNRIDIIDEALLRRFSLKHEVKKFSKIENKSMICKLLDDIGIVYSLEEVKLYSQKELSQAMIMNDVIRSVAFCLKDEKKFTLFTNN